MKNILIKFSLFAVAAILISGIFYFKNKNTEQADASLSQDQNKEEIKIPQDRSLLVDIGDKATYGELMEEAGIGCSLAYEIYNAASSTYDLAKIRVGRQLELVYEKDSDILKRLTYKIDSEDRLMVENSAYYENAGTSTGWIAHIEPIPYEIRVAVKGGEVESSMYEAALEHDIDERAIIELANAFQWSIDFAMDPRVGDEFKFIYEERYLDGEYVMPGRILAGYYVNDGVRHELYYFEENEENKGYFDQDGNSVQKMFLKAPVAFQYISSGYTTGNRVIMEIGLTGPHRAIDYAAPVGTPIRTVGNGTVVFTGWKKGYGYFTSVRHNGTYTTNYAHQSRIAVNYGQKVEQGETIGYVGNTGWSTGPHLHYEMVKNGAKIDPLREILPPGKPIKEENRERFFSEIAKFKETLGL
ncbi:peptidoglycan DD-metalloendopeptidase family protein [Candidatus Falkowbacteria bacterium]|nr:peptidoglycan DD-metalloendopeptidase family protein [Candidatus Falkowbacteria bacterium]